LLSCALFAGALTGCGGFGLGNGPGSWNVDPGKYDGYHCNDLVIRWTQLLDREKELRALMARASQATGGTAIGEVTYRIDYENVLTEKKMVQQQAAGQNCDLVATYQSDQGVH
jgi:hypothetical protein